MAVATQDLMETIGKEQDERAIIKSLKAVLKVIQGNDAEKISEIDPSVVWKRAIALEMLRVNSARHPKLFHYIASEILPWVNTP